MKGKILIIGTTDNEILAHALQTIKMPSDIVVVEDAPKEFKPTQLPPVVLPKINKPKPIDQRDVIPPNYKVKHKRK